MVGDSSSSSFLSSSSSSSDDGFLARQYVCLLLVQLFDDHVVVVALAVPAVPANVCGLQNSSEDTGTTIFAPTTPAYCLGRFK